MSRKTARETAMKLIYQMDMNGETGEEVLASFYENTEDEVSSEDKEYIEGCVTGFEQNREVIDTYISKYSKEWKISRIAKVDLAIMRLSIYEMMQREDVPDNVSVNEAVELSKKYSSDNSFSFVNGILGNVIKEFK